jgi:hypothetical protein
MTAGLDGSKLILFSINYSEKYVSIKKSVGYTGKQCTKHHTVHHAQEHDQV